MLLRLIIIPGDATRHLPHTPEVQTTITCPCCGEDNTISIDESAGSTQDYVEDCQVCCQPWAVRVRVRARDEIEVDVRALDD